MSKKIMARLVFSIATFCCLTCVHAQNINWQSLGENQRDIVNLHAGWDYSMSFGAAYGHKLTTKLPVVLGLAYLSPAGKTLFDDLKTKIGGQAEVARAGNFSATIRLQGNFRRYDNSLVRMASFGAELSGTAGYYRTRWFVAGECGFDKAIVTHLKHSSVAREDFPEIQNGWYSPTAGNFSFGVQAGLSFSVYDYYLKLGRVVSQDFKTTPMIPFYFELGMNARF
ncbi:MAG: hypothetical protein IPN76_14310 [Saprospiraceae bacterium]|nr:hypothetical protein [Saprospiraceae bacterium]